MKEYNIRMITSTANAAVKRVVQLQKNARARRKEGCFPAEGLRLCREIPSDLLEVLYVSESFLSGVSGDRSRENEESREREEKAAFLRRAEEAGISVISVSDHVLAAMSDLPTPQGVLGLCRMPDASPECLIAGLEETGHPPLFLLLENIQDPGNLGTMFRTAEGAGADGILLSRDCADVWSPKVVRATMGSLFRVPHGTVEDWPGMLTRLQERGVRLFAADLRGAVDYDSCDYTEPTGLLIGNEGNGLRPETAAAADARIRIPMGGQLESLNAAMSAGILMYECRRQRRAAAECSAPLV